MDIYQIGDLSILRHREERDRHIFMDFWGVKRVMFRRPVLVGRMDGDIRVGKYSCYRVA